MPLINSKKQGTYKEYYKNGQLRVITQFFEDEREGLHAEFSENGFQINESFFDNDQQKLLKTYKYTSDLQHVKEEIFLIDQDIQVGEIVYNRNWKILPEMSFYFSCEMNTDTLEIGEIEMLDFKIYSTTGYEKAKIWIYIKNEDRIYFSSDTSTVYNNEYKLKVVGRNLGLNKIRGKIFLESDPTPKGEYNLIEFPIYQNFFTSKRY